MAADPFRVIPVRHLGHGYPIATAFGYTIPPATHDLFTSMATGYIVLHAIHRGLVAGSGPQLLPAVFDSLIFDGLASALIPTFITYHVRIIMRSICTSTKNPRPVIVWAPVVAGLATLVFSWRHIDRFVDSLLDQSTRKM